MVAYKVQLRYTRGPASIKTKMLDKQYMQYSEISDLSSFKYTWMLTVHAGLLLILVVCIAYIKLLFFPVKTLTLTQSQLFKALSWVVTGSWASFVSLQLAL